MENKMLQAALKWALFIPVFPCRPNLKQPDTPRGFLDATKDPTVITKWFTNDPTRNLAACPDNAGCWVLDVDGQDGIESLEHLQALYGPLPPTMKVRTPSGGMHLWFEGSRPSSVRIAPGLDTRGVGGYVLLPPSVIDGTEYAFIQS